MPRRKPSEVFVDLCIQTEYLSPGSPLCCANADRILPNLEHLLRFAEFSARPLLSCVDVHYANEIIPRQGPVRFQNGGAESIRPGFALLPRRRAIECDNCVNVALDVFNATQQVLLTKSHRDPFTNPKLDRLLTEMAAPRFVVFGMPLENSVRMLVLGLLRREREVLLIRDACGFWQADEADMALRQLDVKGCKIVTTEQYVNAALKDRQTPRDARRSVA